MVSPRKSCASVCASKVSTRSLPAAKCSFCSSASTRRLASGLCSDSATGTSCTLASTRVRPWRTVCSASGEAPTTRSQASTASACWVSMRTWFRRSGASAPAHERQHRAALLREAHEVEHAGALALEVRGHRDQRADGDHAGAADAGDQQVVRAGPVVRRAAAAARRRGARSRRGRFPGAGLLAQRAAEHADEARAEALHARVVLVAAALVDLALAARARVSCGSTATQLLCTEQSPQPSQTALVDEDAARRVDQLALLAAAALLGGAGLLVDQHRDAGDLAQPALHRVERRRASWNSVPGGNRLCCESYLAMSSLTTTTLLDALGSRPGARSRSTVITPSTGWPPVIATASLNRIL